MSLLRWFFAIGALWLYSAAGIAETDKKFTGGRDNTWTGTLIAAAEVSTHEKGLSPILAPPMLTHRVVRIGHVGPLSGAIAHLGQDNENGARLAIDEANAKGTVIDGRSIWFELVEADDQFDPRVGNAVAAHLVSAGVVGVIGHLNSSTSIPASAIYNQAGIPMLSGASTNPALTEQGFKGVFRLVGRDDMQGTAVANYLVGQIKPKTVAVIDDTTAYGEDLANKVEKTLKSAGVNVLPREKGTDRTLDWKAMLDKIKDKKPDAVFYGGIDTNAGPLIKQAREMKMTAVFAFGDGACAVRMAELAGVAAEGMLCSQVGMPVEALPMQFSDAYFKAYKVRPILYSPFTYDATKILIAAMKTAGSIDPAKFMNALAATNYNGATGNIRFDTKGDRESAETTIFTMHNGRLSPVAVVREKQISPIY